MARDRGNRGVAWERCLERWHDRYRAADPPVAVVFRTPPSVRVLSGVDREHRFRAQWAGEGPPDFAGIAEGVGAVAFDAKSCEHPTRWSFSGLARHQARDLEAVHRAGGYAFVALQLAGIGWVLPWAELGPLWWAWFEREGRAARGEGSLEPATCGWAVRMPTPGDWLGAIR